MLQKIKAFLHPYFPIGRIIFILIWITNLASTDTYFSIYVLIAFFALYLNIRPSGQIELKDHRLLVSFLSVVFSALILLANYPIFTQIGDPERIGRSTSIMVNLINTFLSLIGGIFVAHPILSYWFNCFPAVKVSLFLPTNEKRLSVFVFLSILSIHLIHLFLVEYPGNVTEDPFTQISEMVSGQYSNFNTFWHTMILKSVLSLGYSVFGDVNSAVALFCVFQTVVLVFAFSHCLMTMVKYSVPKSVVVLSYPAFAILPYHLALSITIWKDVLFAAGCLMMLSAWLRLLKKLDGNTVYNYIVFFLGSILFIFSRTNGWMIYLVSFLLYAVFLRKDKKLLTMMGAMAVFGWFLLNPALDMLNVSGGDLAESLSIPVQQVSRVIADDCELSEEESQLLDRVVDLEEVPQLYTNWISDPMKIELRSKDYDYFQAHFSEYVRLWIRLGLKYPGEYVKAWVDQTKGYWNGGYDYAMYSETVTDNPYGVVKSDGGNPVASLFRLYFGLSRHVIFFEPLHSIGLHVWVVILCFLLNVVKKREEWVISVPVLILVVGLWFGTPVYACFRYVYPLFVCFPLILSTSLFSGVNNS